MNRQNYDLSTVLFDQIVERSDTIIAANSSIKMMSDKKIVEAIDVNESAKCVSNDKDAPQAGDIVVGRPVEDQTWEERKATWKKYWAYRIKNSRFTRVFTFDDITPAQADATLQTLAVVTGLLFTIPFSVMGTLNSSYFDSVSLTLANCTQTDTSTTFKTGDDIHDQLSSCISSVLATTVASLMLNAIYYAFRPDDEVVFKQWWKVGKFFVYISYVMNFFNVLFLIQLYELVNNFFMIPTTKLCLNAQIVNSGSAADNRFNTWFVTIIMLSAVSGILML